MNKLYAFLLLFTYYFSFSQEPKLFEKTWFVEEVNLNGVGHSVPSDPLIFPFTYINFYNTSSGLVGSSNEVLKSNCSSGFTAHLDYSGLNNFTITDFSSNLTDSNCDSQDTEMLDFMAVYKEFFTDNLTQNFNYHILDVYGIDHLKIYLDDDNFIWFTEVYTFNVTEPLSSEQWKLSSLIIDDVEQNAPDFSSEGFDYITIDFKNYYQENIYTGTHVLPIENTFIINGCNYNQAILDLRLDNQEFYIYNRGGTLSECGNPQLNAFFNLHYGFYTNHLPGPFTVTLNINESTNELQVTNNIGDIAIYQRQVLSLQDTQIYTLKFYPNPVTDYLTVKTEVPIRSIELFSVLGKHVLASKNTMIDVRFFT